MNHEFAHTFGLGDEHSDVKKPKASKDCKALSNQNFRRAYTYLMCDPSMKPGAIKSIYI